MDDLARYSDEEVVALVLEHKRFFAELVRRYEAKLARYIRRLAALGPEDVEDLLQEIFLKVYQNLNNFDRDLRFSSWIYRIAHNETMEYFRKRKVAAHGHLTDDSDEVAALLASELDLMRQLEANDDAHKLVQAVAEQSAEYRDVLILRYFEHKSYDEISDILTLPPGTVATRLNRAKERVRRTLLALGYNHG